MFIVDKCSVSLTNLTGTEILKVPHFSHRSSLNTNDQCVYKGAGRKKERKKKSYGLFSAYLLLDPQNPAATAEQLPGRQIEAPGSPPQSSCRKSTLTLRSFSHTSAKTSIDRTSGQRHPRPVLSSGLALRDAALHSSASRLSDCVYDPKHGRGLKRGADRVVVNTH